MVYLTVKKFMVMMMIIERFTAFQIAVVDWMSKWNHHPDIVHVHDHQAALIPFMMQHCYAYRHLSSY